MRMADRPAIGREHGTEAVARGLLQDVLGGTGWPVLIVATACLVPLFETVVIAWKDTAASRAIGAAMPCIEQAGRVVVLTVDEAGCRKAVNRPGLDLGAAGSHALNEPWSNG